MTVSDISAWFRGPLLEAVLIVLGALLLSRAANAFASLVSRRRQPVLELPEELRYRRAIERAIARTVIGLMWFVAIVLVVSRLDLPITALVAPATVLGAALGFGAQKLVGDFLSGFFLLAERQLSYGDVVEISPPGTSQWMKGTVEEVTLRYTRLRMTDGGVLTLSNSDVRQVINRSRDWSRVDVTVPVPNDANLEQVTEELRASLCDLTKKKEWKDLLLAEPAVVGVDDLGLDRVDLRISARTVPGAVDKTARELRRRAARVTSGVNGGE